MTKEQEDGRDVSLAELPNDPMEMPPPYWRGSGAIFHVLSALDDLIKLLQELIPVHERTEEELYEYFASGKEDPESRRFTDITDDLMELEHRIKLKSDMAIFMTAIHAEDTLNRFCVYNVHKDIAESTEKLASPDKLLVAAAVVGAAEVRGNSVFEGMRKLTAWRNSFAHGHCVDRPTKTLRHNHLIAPAQYPGVPDSIASVRKLLRAYLALCKFLTSISLNDYTKRESLESKEIEAYLQTIGRYKFELVHSNIVYSVSFE